MAPSDVEHVIPFDRLPKGFAQKVDAPADPVVPRPAATILLLRESRRKDAPEVLLLRRARSAGFVPGAFVFPGGRVDPADGEDALLARMRDEDAHSVAMRLGLSEDPARGIAFFAAAVREAFEETGIPLLRSGDGEDLAPRAGATELEGLRWRLRAGAVSFREVLEELDAWMDAGSVGYISHWITPEAEPKRYDTRFFAAAVPPGTTALVDHEEVTEAVWLTPAEALTRYGTGSLPLVFPTVKTMESLRQFTTPGEVLEYHREREVPPIIPHFVRTDKGIGIRIPLTHGNPEATADSRP